MAPEVSLRQSGGSVSATIPKELARRFHLKPGDRIQAIETEDGILLTPFAPTVQQALALASEAAFGAAGVGWPEFFKQERQGLVQLESACGGVGELKSDCCDKASNLALACSSHLVSCSISKTGRQFSIAKQRRQSGNVERYSDLLIQ